MQHNDVWSNQMNDKDIKKQIERLGVWTRRGIRAPHKPLLVLWALGQCLKGKDRIVSYREAGPKLHTLLRKFGPPRKTLHPEAPFWHLKNDGIWEIPNAGNLPISGTRPKGRGPSHKTLLDKDVHGGFVPEVFDQIQHDPPLVAELVYTLLDAHFPPSLHSTILLDTGIDLRPHEVEVVKRKPRDPEFSRRVSTAYDFRCAVCSFAGRLVDRPIALEAAHIKWHCAQGPDQINNGLCLCVLHHRLFDAGAFTLSDKFRVMVSPSVNGAGMDEVIRRFESTEIHLPSKEHNLPNQKFLEWHQREVFDDRI